MHGRVNAILHKETGRILVQKPIPPTNCLALEGAGSAGAAYAGFFKVWDDYGLSQDVECITGISAGAITGLARCINYTGDELVNIMTAMPAKDFSAATESWSWTPEPLAAIRQLASHYLLINSVEAKEARERLLTWLREMIAPKMDGNGRATTRDLARKIAEQKARHPDDNTYKNLIIGATCFSKGIPSLVIFDLLHSPEIELAELGLISACHMGLMGVHEWDGHSWGDGGTKSVILTKVLDKIRLLPKGYGFTEARVNPGVLAVKIDTEQEIEKLWGIVEDEVLDTRMKVVKKISTAILDNNNEHEMREERNVLALSDCGINRGKLDYPVSELMKLVDKAMVDTREYLENYIDAAYEVKSYINAKEWLKSCSIEELSELTRTYNQYLIELDANVEETAQREKLPQFDPARPTSSHLQNQIHFLKKYIKARVRGDADELERIEFPQHHINISPAFPAPKWHKILRKELESRLVITNEKIKKAEYEFQRLKKILSGLILPAMPHGFNGWRCEAVQKLVVYQNYLGNMRRERDKVENKLGMKCAHHPVPDKVQSERYALFYAKIVALNKGKELSAALSAVTLKSPPIVDFSVEGKVPFKVTLDLREENDRNLYLIAALMYLKQRGYADTPRFQEIYNHFLSFEWVAPVTPAICMGLLNQDALSAQMSMYIIENLIHYFEKCESPTSEPAMNLNGILKLPALSFMPPPNEAIAADFPEAEFNAIKIENSQDGLALLRKKNQDAEHEYQRLLTHFSYHVNEDAPSMFYHWRSIHVQKILIYREWMNQLHRDYAALESKDNPDWVDPNMLTEDQYQPYLLFYEKISELKNAKDLSNALSAVVMPNLPIVNYADDTTMPFKFSLDMRMEQDRKLYLMAAFIYLSKRGYSDTPRFKTIVELFLPGFNMQGINAAALGSEISICIIENLIHCFEKIECPTYKPSMDLNAILGLPVAPLVTPPDRNITDNFPAIVYQENQENDWVAKTSIIAAKLQSARAVYQLKLDAYSMPAVADLHGSELNWLQDLVEHDGGIRTLERKLADVQCRAGLACSHKPLLDTPENFAYKVFYQRMLALNGDKDLSYAMRAVISNCLPVTKFSDDSIFACNLELDMRALADRQIYLLAGLIYLEKRGYKDTEKFKQIYRMTFPDETAAPATLENIKRLLNQNGALLQLSLFTIETLLHHFERAENSKYKPALDIDNVLSVSPYSFFAVPPKPADPGRELPVLLNTSGRTAPPGYVQSFQAKDYGSKL